MKLHHEERGARVDVVVSGDLETASCTCLENFWALRVDGHAEIEVDLSDVDAEDGAGVATLVALVAASLRAGARVALRQAPQMVAHTLYKTGHLRDGSGLTLIDPRAEEPYG